MGSRSTWTTWGPGRAAARTTGGDTTTAAVPTSDAVLEQWISQRNPSTTTPVMSEMSRKTSTRSSRGAQPPRGGGSAARQSHSASAPHGPPMHRTSATRDTVSVCACGSAYSIASNSSGGNRPVDSATRATARAASVAPRITSSGGNRLGASATWVGSGGRGSGGGGGDSGGGHNVFGDGGWVLPTASEMFRAVVCDGSTCLSASIGSAAGATAGLTRSMHCRAPIWPLTIDTRVCVCVCVCVDKYFDTRAPVIRKNFSLPPTSRKEESHFVRDQEAARDAAVCEGDGRRPERRALARKVA